MGKGGTCRLQRVSTLFSGRLSSTSGPLAQPGRALASHARGHWFKSSTVHWLRVGASSRFRIMRAEAGSVLKLREHERNKLRKWC